MSQIRKGLHYMSSILSKMFISISMPIVTVSASENISGSTVIGGGVGWEEQVFLVQGLLCDVY